MSSLISNPKVRLYTATLRPNGSNIAASKIFWELLKSNNGHASNLITSATSDTDTNSLDINFNQVLLVHSFCISFNDKLIANNVNGGPTVSFTNAKTQIYQSIKSNYPGYIRGNATNFTTNGDMTSVGIVTNTISDFTFTPPAVFGAAAFANNVPYFNWVTANYVGSTLDRRIVRLTGLAANTFGYQLQVASTGVAVTSNSTSDIIEIVMGLPNSSTLSAVLNGAAGFQGNIFTKDSRLFVTAYLELP